MSLIEFSKALGFSLLGPAVQLARVFVKCSSVAVVCGTLGWQYWSPESPDIHRRLCVL